MLRKIIVNICRMLLAVVFIFSGFVKAIDPLGTVYKMQDYLAAAHAAIAAAPEWLLTACAIALSTMEFLLGIFLFFGFHRRVVTKLTLVFMVIMTAITTWIWIADPVKDCGCFGDALILTNTQTLLKNIILLACAVTVALRHDDIIRYISLDTQWIVVNYTILFIAGITAWSLYDLPLFDFRPYHVGADMRQDTEIPEGAEQPQFETTFILQKNGEQREFTIDNYPDSTWTFVDSHTTQTSEGYVPPMHDFSIEDKATGTDLTDSIAKRDGYTFLLIAPDLEKAADSNFGYIDRIYEYCTANDYPFCCLTASGDKAQQEWRDKTGAEYPFYFTDHTTLKTMIRSNPGLMLLKDGKIIGKWSHNNLPAINEESPTADKAGIADNVKKSNSRKALSVILWFIIPLILLTLADRLWAWSKWVKRIAQIKERKQQKKNNNDNEKKDCSRQLENES